LFDKLQTKLRRRVVVNLIFKSKCRVGFWDSTAIYGNLIKFLRDNKICALFILINYKLTNKIIYVYTVTTT